MEEVNNLKSEFKAVLILILYLLEKGDIPGAIEKIKEVLEAS